jgi:Immunoglobulin domain
MKRTAKLFLVAVTLLCLAGCGSSGSNGKGSSGGNSSGSGSVAPAITTQPSPQTVTAGQSATFTVSATGTPTPTYQWQKNSANISGATQSSYTIASTTTSDAGSYQVVVSNTAGTVKSNSVSLTVDSAPGSPAPPSGSSVSVLT